MNSMRFGRPIANYRELFRVAGRSGKQPDAHKRFFDELEAIGMVGQADGHDSAGRWTTACRPHFWPSSTGWWRATFW